MVPRLPVQRCLGSRAVGLLCLCGMSVVLPVSGLDRAGVGHSFPSPASSKHSQTVLQGLSFSEAVSERLAWHVHNVETMGLNAAVCAMLRDTGPKARARISGFKSGAMWLWVGYSTSLCISFLIFKKGVIIIILMGLLWGITKVKPIEQCLLQSLLSLFVSGSILKHPIYGAAGKCADDKLSCFPFCSTHRPS